MFAFSQARASHNLKSFSLGSAVATALLGGIFTVPVAAQSAPARNQASPETVETVVVTARRRSENEQNVPIAMSVLSGDQIAASGHDNLRDLYLQVPSLKVVDVNPRNATLTIRGLGANLANEGLVNSVGIFVDGVYEARPGAAAFDQFDVDQIEVLRGPQGTLFGKNTTAGALNITTRLPTFDPEANLEASYGDFGYDKVAATVSAPLSDTVAVRATASMTSRAGFIDNVDTGEKDNDFNEKSFRGQMLWKPNEDFSLRLIGDYEFQRTNCCVDVIAGVANNYDDGTPISNGFYARSALLGYTPLPVDPFARKTDIDSLQLIRTQQFGFSVEANWNVLGGTVTSISAFRGWHFDPYNDLDMTALPVLTQGAYSSRSQQITQELRYASPSDQPVEYVLGLYYLYESLSSNTLESFGDAAGGWILPTLPLTITTPALAGFEGVGFDRAYTESYAGFGQATWHITDALSLTGGLRYTYEQKWGYGQQVATGGEPLSDFPPNLQPTIAAIRAGAVSTYDTRTDPAFPQSHSEGNISGTASFGYKLSEDTNLYATYARGYKSGGINFVIPPAGTTPPVNPQIKPETSDDYEIGVKTELFDRRLLLNTALYWTNVSNYQSTVQLLTQSGAFVPFVSNVGQLRSRGIEADGEAILGEGLTATASLAYADAIYLSYPQAPCPLVNAAQTCDLSNSALPNVSKWALSGGISYDSPWAIAHIANDALKPFFNANVSYRSGFKGGASERTTIDGYEVTDLSIGLRLAEHGTELSFWAHNLFNENYYLTKSSLVFNTGAISAELGDPRTIGVSLRQKF